MNALRRLRIVNAILLATCGGMGWALWERSKPPAVPDPESVLARHVKPVRFEGKSVKDCIQELTASAGGSAEVDWGYLEGAGMPSGAPVTVSIGDVALSDAKTTIIASLGKDNLRSTIQLGEREGVAYIGQNVPQRVVVRLYDLSWIHRSRPSTARYVPEYSTDPGIEAVAQLISQVRISRPAYGTGSATWMFCMGDRLLVRDTPDTQSVIANYVGQLRGAVEHPVDLTDAKAQQRRTPDETRAYLVRDLVPNPRRLVGWPIGAGEDIPPEAAFLHAIELHAGLHHLVVKLSYWDGMMLATCTPEQHDAIVRVLQAMRAALKK
jgi:hypothetical protein